MSLTGPATSQEPGDFSPDSPLRIPHIDRIGDVLVAVCVPAMSLGEKDGQGDAQPFIFYRLGVDGSSPDKFLRPERPATPDISTPF